ncbi:MAG: LytTR family transcriptional regulator DNA-binding domain-containing protein [Clostridium sp.]
MIIRLFSSKITLKNLQNQLPKEFVRCHRTVIVNMNKVMRLTNKDYHSFRQFYLSCVGKLFGACS